MVSVTSRATGSAGKSDLKLSAKGAPCMERHHFDGARARQRELGRTNRPTWGGYPGRNLLSMNDERPLARAVAQMNPQESSTGGQRRLKNYILSNAA
jgi:hypothetical protein